MNAELRTDTRRADLSAVLDQVNRRYLRAHPASAARRLESRPLDEAAAELGSVAAQDLIVLWPHFSGDAGASLLDHLPDAQARDLLGGLLPTEASRFLGALDEAARERLLDLLAPDLKASLVELMNYPEDTAGRLMERQLPAFRADVDAAAALDALRRARGASLRTVFVIDADNRLAGQVPLQTLALATPGTPLRQLMLGAPAAVHPMSPREEVAETAEKHRLNDLPVVDLDARLIGVIPQERLVRALQEEAAADIGTMVGVSPQERALSKPWFAVRKRLPWLQINLVTAFIAASVVGFFESTIAQFTALAVLMPVVAGEAGNAGQQALAVTMRGLVLREITVRQWLAVTIKELGVGAMNGVLVASVCGLAVWLWSGSLGLVLIIVSAMVLAIAVATCAGAAVPLVLTRLGQDPAQSSSILLTTITDITGFFAFLGIATLLSSML